jgi:hypothetical protein
MQTSRATTHIPTSRRRRLAVVPAVGLVAAIAVAGCSGSDSDNGGGGGSADSSAARVPAAADAPAPSTPDGKRVLMADGMAYSLEASSGSGQEPAHEQASNQSLVIGQALIKTAAIDLRSDDIQGIIDKIYGLALTTGGRVDSEDTSTDSDGKVNHSRLEVKVPVAKFDDAVSQIYDMARDHTKQTSTEDVTAKLADVTSRVESAKASIQQLRRLFDRATALGQVIRLERELSQREADLESLQAQQRSLNAQTTMSTILVTVTLPPKVAPPVKAADDHQAGFVSGIKKGWDAMVTFVVGASHAFGLVLPLTALAIAVCLALWPLARRFTPRREGSPQPSE